MDDGADVIRHGRSPMSDGPRACWRMNGRSIELTAPVVMGILNTTPDSFHEGGRLLDPEAALARALEMSSQGARISMSEVSPLAPVRIGSVLMSRFVGLNRSSRP